MTNKPRLILASSSPRRKELLGHLKIPFEILTKHTDEISSHTDPALFSAEIAAQKGEVVAESITDSNALIISADTVVALNGVIYGKPGNKAEARRVLYELSGKTHSVFTAVHLIKKENGQIERRSFVEESNVSFNKISTYLMDVYIASGDSLDKAGAYGIQGGSLSFISKVDGCYANVVGLPLSRLAVELETWLGEDIWSKYF